jgi:uncharacterized protein YecT (DUF1311 family)
MTRDRADIPWGREWSSATYHGFAGAPPSPTPRPDAARGWRALRTPRAATIGVGVLAALGLGLGLGFLSQPKLAAPGAAAPMRAVQPAGALDVQVNAPTPPQVVKPAGKLEVLSPEMARDADRAAAAAAAPPAAPPSIRIAGQPATPMVTPPQPISPRLAEITPPPRIASPQQFSGQRYSGQPYAGQAYPGQASAAQPGAGADPACSGARGRAAQMVCADPELAADDRELNRAYRRALRSVSSPEQLRAEQRDWLAIREDAARRSPRAVASIYEQRIDELNRIADEDDPRE